MRLKYRIQTFLQFIAFAFYPKTTLIACTVFSLVVIAVLALVMASVPEGSVAYNIVFALTTGATGSFFVSIIVELSSNYRNNKLAWQELQDYYSIITDYECSKQVLLRNTPSQRAERKAKEEFVDAVFKSNKPTSLTEDLLDELSNIVEERSLDIVEATWKQLPKIMPVLRDTLEHKKAFLNDDEILELRVICDDYDQIRYEIKRILEMSPMFYDILNRPDEEYLDYPTNMLTDMPDWIRKHLASNEGHAALERLTDAMMADSVLLSMLLDGYDISLQGIEANQSKLDDDGDDEEDLDESQAKTEESADQQQAEDDEDSDEYDFYEPDAPEEHRKYCIEMDKVFLERLKPFVSWHISTCCKEIAESIDIIEKNIMKKPYYSIRLKFDRDAAKQKLDDPMTAISYESEKKRMEELLKRQETNQTGR